jgi:beta-N-acetylhexosaminidase
MSPEDSLSRAVNAVLLPGFTGTTAPGWLLDAIDDGLAGVVYFRMNTPDLATTAALSAQLRARRADLVIGIDEEGGNVTRLQAAEGSSLPGAGALGAIDTVELTRATGRALGELLASVGVNLDLAPVLDVNSAADNPVIGVRAFGSEPELVGRHGAAFVHGLHDAAVSACGKHFPGHGSTVVDSHLALPTVVDDLATITARDLPPFTAALNAGLDSLMTAHVVVPALSSNAGVPASLDRQITSRTRRMGLRGPVITDALDMGAVAHDPGFGEACVRALLAGADLLCLGTTLHCDDEAQYRTAHDAIVEAVETGRLHRAQLAEAAERGRQVRPLPRRRPVLAWSEARTRLEQIGAETARRAVGWAGAPTQLPADARPVLIDLRTRYDHAAGLTAPHLVTAITAAWPGTRPLDGDRAQRGPLPTDAPVLVIARDHAGDAGERRRLAEILAERPDSVVLYAGTAQSAPQAQHVLLTWGVGRANAQAAVEVLQA